ncbi:MAG: hypothetical protein ACTHNG_12705 [Ginsengibacter sp.]
MIATEKKSLLNQFKLNKKVIVRFDYNSFKKQNGDRFIQTITYPTSGTNPPTMDSQSL